MTLRTTSGREIILEGDIWAIPSPSGNVDHLLGVFADVTEARQLDAALQHTARSEAISSLTSGITHDFNNLLTVLVGNLYLVAEGVRDDPTLFEQTKRARDVAKRGADLTRQLLSFSSEDRVESRTLDTGQLVSNLKLILDHTLGSRISLKLAIAPNVAHIDASAAQLESVIVNLVINARDAIEAKGTITIKAQNRSLDEDAGRQYGLAPGDYVSLSITDDGAGIPEVIQARVFDPFFSTKGKNRGTGLGLSMVRSFAEHLGGAVDLSSRPGIGTTITLLLPASSGTPEDSALLTMPLKTLPTGNENILLLAEDLALSKTVEESLAILGYTTRVSNEPTELTKLLSTNDFALTIIDSSTGSEIERRLLTEKIRSLDITTAVLVISSSAVGCSTEPVMTETLKKPFTLKDLAVAVRSILDKQNDD